MIDSLREELEKTKVSLFDEKEVQRKLQLALDQAKTETQDLERAERVVRVDLEQSSKKVLLFYLHRRKLPGLFLNSVF